MSTAPPRARAPRRACDRSALPRSIALIAGRLVMFAVVPRKSFRAARRVRGDAIATARPDILDRNGEMLATDVRAPSLFAEPRRIIDVDEAVELLTAVLPDLDADRSCASGSARSKRLRLAQARDHAEAAAGDLPARPSRHRLPRREQARLSEQRRSLARDRPRQYRQPGHRRHREMARRARACRRCIWPGFATDRLQKPVELAVDLRVQHALRDELIVAARRNSRPRPRPASSSTCDTGEIVSMVSLPDYDPNNPQARRSIRPASTA